MNYYIFFAFIIAFLWGISPVLFKFILEKNIPWYIIIFVQASVYLLSSAIFIIIYKYNDIYKDLQQNINYIPSLIVISFLSIDVLISGIFGYSSYNFFEDNSIFDLFDRSILFCSSIEKFFHLKEESTYSL